MVIENNPTAQCVGLELVRQYYTLLNKAPMYLHRFYSNESVLTHGGLPGTVPEVVRGQSEIHKKIISLGFKDCHAKIRLVTAHTTVENGVVVQVIGELSNDGAPMRPFNQTFVLVPQSPKKYYVHNDIFHYQDDAFKDIEGNGTVNIDEGVSSGPEDELETPTSATLVENFAPTLNGTGQIETEPIKEHTPPPPQSQTLQAPPITSPQPQAPASTPVKSSPPAATAAPPPPPAPLQSIAPETTPETSSTFNKNWTETSLEQPHSPVRSPAPKSTPTKPMVTKSPAPSEPKTYANLLKNSSSSFSAQSATNAKAEEKVQLVTVAEKSDRNTPPQRSDSSRGTALTNGNSPSSAASGTGGARPKFFQGKSRPTSKNQQNNESSNATHNNGRREQEKRSALPDTHQVFVGNLHHSVNEELLKEKFSTWGKVTEIRINTAKGKTQAKGNGHQVPNFGFVGFETKESVDKCLSERPIYLNGDRINVEEKKARNIRVTEERIDRPPPAGRGTGRGQMRGTRGRGGFQRERNGEGRGNYVSRR